MQKKRIKKSINIASVFGLPHPLCAHTHTHTHAYKMFNINICKFLEQRRRIKTHAWNSYKLLRSGGSRQRRGRGSEGSLLLLLLLLLLGRWKSAPHPFVLSSSFSYESAGMCVLWMLLPSSFFGVRLELRGERGTVWFFRGRGRQQATLLYYIWGKICMCFTQLTTQ